MSLDIEFLPIERMAALPSALDGRDGTNRGNPANLTIPAQNDLDAVRAFLNEYRASPATLRAYRKECDRLILWATLKRGKPLSSLDYSDFDDYLQFLVSPDPAWCGPRAERFSPGWKPFVGGLSPAAINVALASLGSMLSWLVAIGYLRSNPLVVMRQKKKKIGMAVKVKRETKVERYLDDVMWAAFTDVIDSMPKESYEECERYERARFLANLLYLLAPRVSELVSHTMGSFRETSKGWFWHVNGKGDKDSRVAVPPDMLEALKRYRRFLELDDVPAEDDLTPLVPALRERGGPARGIGARQINMLLDELFDRAACRLDRTSPSRAKKLRAASAHWGRHTSITAKVRSGMDLRLVQADARHASIDTTRHYTHDDDEERLQEAAKQHMSWGKKD